MKGYATGTDGEGDVERDDELEGAGTGRGRYEKGRGL